MIRDARCRTPSSGMRACFPIVNPVGSAPIFLALDQQAQRQIRPRPRWAFRGERLRAAARSLFVG